ncbi:MAG: hypothetical protein AAF968_24140 [Pseudomonadota bacterium]
MLGVLAMTFMTATRNDPAPQRFAAPKVSPCPRHARRHATRLGAFIAFLRGR